MLSLNNIEVIYSNVILVLRGVSLEVPEGKIVALLGANGAGKSTTLKAISGLLHSQEGEVTRGSIEFRGQADRSTCPRKTSSVLELCRCSRADAFSSTSRWRRT